MMKYWARLILVLAATGLVCVSEVLSANDASTAESLANSDWCCGGPNSAKWEIFRLIDGVVLDYREILISRPKISRAVFPCQDENRVDMIFGLYGEEFDTSDFPLYEGNVPYYFAEVRGVGQIRVTQHTPGETWLFRIGSVFIEKEFPVSYDLIPISWEYKDSNGTILAKGNTMLTNDSWMTKECKDLSGTVIERTMYGGSATAFEELETGWREQDYFQPVLPAKLGRFYFWPISPGGTYTVRVGESEFQGKVD